MTEVGSDFYKIEKKNTAYFLSGRTAEEYIIRDILATGDIHSALLPSFCCHTMIEPFFRHGIPVKFYDVYFEKGSLRAGLPKKKEGEVLLYLNYFGYGRLEGLERVQDWDVTIEDCTHSWMSHGSSADYSFISYRKWTGFTGIARADKKSGMFTIPQKKEQYMQYEESRARAMELKRQYLEDGKNIKERYLAEFKTTEELLEDDYTDYRPSYDSLLALLSLDKEALKIRRRENAEVLLQGLERLDGVTPLFPKLGEADVPLNVPVLVEGSVRNRLRKYLVQHEIFCPIHWPLSELHGISDRAKDIFNEELSLICDQRYGSGDMDREIKVISDFFKYE